MITHAPTNFTAIFMTFLPFALPSIGEEEIAEVVDTLRSGWLTTGTKTKQFEREFATHVGVPHALAVNSATAGLHLAVEALGVGPNDWVVTTPYTFTATAEVIRYVGADPLFVDIDPATLNVDPEAVAAAMESRPGVKAIMPVHFAGLQCDMRALTNIARRDGVKVVEDAAHLMPAVGAEASRVIRGDVSAYSFYATKTITTGEGGMITTADDAVAERIRTMRLHGISRDVFDRYSSTVPSWYYEVVAPGFKYNMTDLAAAIGIHQLRKAESFQRRREAIARSFSEAFADLPLRLPPHPRTRELHSWHLYVIRLNIEDLAIDRDEFIRRMAAEGIGTSVHFIPLHLQPYWRDRYGFKPNDFPAALDAYKRAVSLPIYPKMTDDDVTRVIEAVRRILVG